MEHEVQNVLAAGDLHQFAHWKVYYGTNIKQAQIVCSSENVDQPQASLTWESTRPILESHLRLLGDGVYTIHYKKEPGEKYGFMQKTFRITSDAASAIGSTTQAPNPAMPPMFFIQQLMADQSKLMHAEIGRVSAELTHKFEIKQRDEEIEKLKKQLKEKKEGGLSFTEVLKEVKQGFFEFKALKESGAANKPAIAISGTGADPITGTKETIEETDPDETEEPFVFRVSSSELAEMYTNTLQQLSKLWGGNDETVINLHCLNQLMREEKALYEAFILPRLTKIREGINEL